jgi:hypothetical protein
MPQASVSAFPFEPRGLSLRNIAESTADWMSAQLGMHASERLPPKPCASQMWGMAAPS